MFRIFLFWFLTFLCIAPAAFAKPFWSSKASQAEDTALAKLKPGQFIWKDTNVSAGSMKAEVNLSEQKIYLYRNGALVAVSTVSTGKGTRSTPTGIFTVKGKSRYHRSKKYHNAPMPYTHWLTAKNIAIHAGNLPGYPASHGCIRVPTKFARLLFHSSSVGMPVVITNHKKAATELAHSHPLPDLPVDRKESKIIKTANSSPHRGPFAATFNALMTQQFRGQ